MDGMSINLENKGHEKESIYRAADHWFLEAGRGHLARVVWGILFLDGSGGRVLG